MTIERIALGQFEIHGLRDGFFHLDGGAMFGVVPKPLWEKIFPSDSQNRIKLALNSFLIDTGRSRVLVETGVGSDLEEKIFKYYSVERERRFSNIILWRESRDWWARSSSSVFEQKTSIL